MPEWMVPAGGGAPLLRRDADMKVVSFEVRMFRNVLSSGEVPVDSAITCLVGKNEAGKTNLLHALHAIRPAPTQRAFTEQEYPRWLQKAHQRTGDYDKAVPITARFELSEDDVKAVEDRFGAGVLTAKAFTRSLQYAGSGTYDLQVDEAAACRAFETRCKTETQAVTLEALREALETARTETAPDTTGTPVATEGAQRAQAALKELNELLPNRERLDAAIAELLQGRMPLFFYFDQYSQLEGRTDIAPLVTALRAGSEASLSDSQRTALSLLKLGFATEDLINADYEKRSGELEAVAADLTGQVQRYWHQNDHLRLRIDVEAREDRRPDGQHIVNRVLQLRVEDTRHFFTNNLDVRSSGFRWFISFLAAFKEFASGQSVVVLLDEPALALHARAQADFLYFIEETLGAQHQVIYTTHSIFMVDPRHLERVRVVEDMGPDEGAVVKTQLMSRDPDTLSPLQGALGYDIAQNIFVGPDNLVVEGLSDYTYLSVVSEALRQQGRPYLNDRWRILPAGGAGSMPAAVSLLGQHLDVTVLVDGGSKLPQRLGDLVDEGVLEGKRVILLGRVVGMKAADVEDLFAPEDYVDMYNRATGASVRLESLDGPEDRIVARLTRALGSYNHNDPANWLLRHRTEATASFRSVTWERFEKVIDVINRTLTE